jgi:hypothetical protein
VHNGFDFFGALAAGAGEGHRERSINIEGREDEVPVASRQLFVAVSGEGVQRGRHWGVGGRQHGSEQDR